MRIGIDIDDTLTDIKEKLNKAVHEYASSLKKEINKDKNLFEDSKNDGNAYQRKYNFTYEELKYFLGPVQESITESASPRKDVAEIIKRLKQDNHEIYIITARDSEFHNNPYEQSRIWLERHKIIYDKLIVNARNKADVCKKEKVDILIDDQLQNCLSVLNEDISVIRISNEKRNDMPSFTDWNDVYNYISNMDLKNT